MYQVSVTVCSRLKQEGLRRGVGDGSGVTQSPAASVQSLDLIYRSKPHFCLPSFLVSCPHTSNRLTMAPGAGDAGTSSPLGLLQTVFKASLSPERQKQGPRGTRGQDQVMLPDPNRQHPMMPWTPGGPALPA